MQKGLPSTLSKVIVLDFDGVVIDSTSLKDRIFQKLFSDFPDHLDELMTFHFQHHTLSRYEKFKYILFEMLGPPDADDKYQSWCLRFDVEARQAAIHCPEIQGAKAFLTFFCERVPLFVASATPETELNKIIDARGLRPFFKGTYGNPALKKETFSRILDSENVKSNEVLYFGDSPEDWQVALEMDVPFVGIKGVTDFEDKGCVVFDHLEEALENLVRDYGLY